VAAGVGVADGGGVIITLLTDFGTVDGYVGAMKGVLASLTPAAVIHDVSHDLPAGGIREAARALHRYWLRYPPGTVHLVVVDPGVGTRRRPLALSARGRFLVAPDNGVATPLLAPGETTSVVEIQWPFPAGGQGGAPAPDPFPLSLSRTFHGRDLFAPAAAWLALGGAMAELGPQATDPPLVFREPSPRRGASGVLGEVVGMDRFGNLQTNLPGEWFPRGGTVELAGWQVYLVESYGFREPGELLAVVNSDGVVEVAVRDGSAAAFTGAGPGTSVFGTPSS